MAQPPRAPAASRTTPEPAVDGEVRLRGKSQAMLAVCAGMYPAGMTEAQVAMQAGIKRSSGTFDSYKSLLRTSGSVEIRDGLWYATKEGMRRMGAGIPKAPKTTDEVLALWLPKLRGKSREMMLHLVKKRGGWVSYADLSDAVGIVRSSGTFDSYVSLLRTTGLIMTESGSARANKEVLFL